MAIRPNGTALRQFRTLFHLGTTGDQTDGQLLERFATGRGEAAELAFAAIVERHGPLVLRVCRAILRDEHDAQDAFQATFLVLVRKARSLWVKDSLGPWLHAVAHRAARCSRSSRDRRRSIERDSAEAVADPIGVDRPPDDLAEVLHAEIERLPERYRALVVLCDLEGLTHDQAARRLGCPVGTVKSRLSRARLRLRDRLSQRGLAPGGRVGPAVAAGGARVLVPPSLVRSTIELAVQSASGGSAGVAIPATVALLAQGVSSAMIQIKLAQLAVPVLALALSAGAGIEAFGNGRPPAGSSPGGEGTSQSDRDQDNGILLLEVGPGRPTPTLSARGNMEATRTADIRSPIDEPTTILSIVPEGTVVEPGKPVCELDPAPLDEALDWARLSAIRFEGAFSSASNKLLLAETHLKEYLEGVYPSEISIIEGEIALAESEMERATDRLDWSDDMFKLGYISQAQNRGDKADHERARFNLDAARKKREYLETIQRPKTVKALEADVEEARGRMIELKALRDSHRERVQRLHDQIEQCSIVAPIGGVVVHLGGQEFGRSLEKGDAIGGRQIFMRIVDLDHPMRLILQVTKPRVDRLSPGQRARVRVDAFPNNSFDGSVIEVSSRPDQHLSSMSGRTIYPALIELDEPSPMLRPGMTAEARIRASEGGEPPLRIPSRAVLRHDGEAYVALRRPGGGFEWRSVALGLSDGRLVEVEAGIRPGDLLAIDPIALLRRGPGADVAGPDRADP